MCACECVFVDLGDSGFQQQELLCGRSQNGCILFSTLLNPTVESSWSLLTPLALNWQVASLGTAIFKS